MTFLSDNQNDPLKSDDFLVDCLMDSFTDERKEKGLGFLECLDAWGNHETTEITS